uniref:Uncharacterized protein n=1 Tax=Clytia hemisphaerica TaxID=252671 RepID=A0A7M5VG94_9CNID|eukprot:TCONS_00039417-protein
MILQCIFLLLALVNTSNGLFWSFNQFAYCPRTPSFCSYHGASYFFMDCNADGIKDNVCLDNWGRFSMIIRFTSFECMKKDFSSCNLGNNKMSCKRPSYWCTHNSATFLFQDCDGDGIPDPVCSDKWGSMGIISSSNGCKNTWPQAKCKTAKGNACKRPSGFCSYWGVTYDLFDCDGDGIPDPICTDHQGVLSIISSKNGCKPIRTPNGKCQTKKGLACPRPKNFCNQASSSKFMYLDCDGDGIPDPVCSMARSPKPWDCVKSSDNCKIVHLHRSHRFV